MSRRTRRQFVRESTAAATAITALGSSTANAAGPAVVEFASSWQRAPNRVWIGPEFWANPLQDWRLAGGRVECHKAAPERHVHLLTHALTGAVGNFATSVRVGLLQGELGAGQGSAGFRIGIRATLRDYRHALIFGEGLDAGITGSGKLFVGAPDARDAVPLPRNLAEVELRLTAEPQQGTYALRLQAVDLASGDTLAAVRRSVPAEQLVGQLALVANAGNFGPARRQPMPRAGIGADQFWFADWRASGSKLQHYPGRAFGPILFSQYTISRGVLKLTAQMPPLGESDTKSVTLEVHREGDWQAVAEAPIDPVARTATFRIEPWDATQRVPYRVVYGLAQTGGTTVRHEWTGIFRPDPVEQPVLTVADVSCNGHMAFPNADYVAHMERLNPDLLAFTGDQFYEGSGAYGVQRSPLEASILDMLRKWYLHGWTWRTLMRDRPSISIPDDHDVYQGNVWGEGGEPRRGTQEMGGYDMPPEWVNAVHKTQTSHHPDPPDPSPGKRGISVYFGPLVYGGVSFAILADRQFKSGPEGKVPPTGNRGDHVVDPDFDPQTADLPGLELLGERQMRFLRDWVGDWRGAVMKAVISQTTFTAMATTHGPGREILRADYDANGWPQAARNAALREIRRTLAFHIAGDQHLPAVVRYGIDKHGDAGAALAGPPVNNIYPRWFEPQGAMIVRADKGSPCTGEFIDHFGHPLSVLAVANPSLEFRGSVLEVERDKSCGLALVRFEKLARRVTIECWPLLVDPLQPNTQFPGWPVTIEPLTDSIRMAAARLPRLKITGAAEPLVQVFAADGDLLYNLRITSGEFQPHVFSPGTYRVRILDPESGRSRELSDLVAREHTGETIEVSL